MQKEEVIVLNINVGGIIKKIESKADWVAFLVAAYSRYPDISRLIEHYTNVGEGGALWQAGQTLQIPGLLKYKLWESPHLYTTAFKYSLFARLLAEIDILPAKYKKLTEKIMIGAGAAAFTLGGSGPNSNPRHNSRGVGGDPYTQELY